MPPGFRARATPSAPRWPPLDAAVWIGRSHAACFLQFARRDEFITHADAEAYASAAS